MNQIAPQRTSMAQETGFDAVVGRMAPVAQLQARQQQLRESYLAAQPYPHLVLDGLFDPDILDRLGEGFPGRGQRDWLSYDTANEVKQTSRGLIDLDAFSQAFLWQMCSKPMMDVLRAITDIPDLCVDPLFHGGGLHESFRGGWLNLHADWTQHPVLPLTRQLNLIVYLNRDWDPAWGGALELWTPGAKECGARVEPLFNRAVLFPTTAETLHGFPEPMTCPANRSRRSASLFFWSPDEGAIKQGAPISFLPGTRGTQARAMLRSLVPPAAFTARDRLRALLRRGG